MVNTTAEAQSPLPAAERSSRTALTRWAILRRLLGIVLLVAAGLKAEELASLPLLGPGLLNQRWLLVGLIEIEAVLAGFLIFSKAGFGPWVCTLLLWIAFTGVALYEAIAGAESCGCFGRISINPSYTAGFDLLVLIALLLCSPGKYALGPYQRYPVINWSAIGAVALAGIVFGVWNLNRYKASRLSEDGLSFVDGTVILEPAKWVGHRFLLANYIDIGSQLEHGDWIALLYRYDCEHCQRAVPKYLALGKVRPAAGPLVMFVEIPPVAPAGQELVRKSGGIHVGQLSLKYEWFASIPVRVDLHNGTVQTIAEGEAAGEPGDAMITK